MATNFTIPPDRWIGWKDKAEQELAINIKKATSTDETAPKQKHVRKCIEYTWDHLSSISFWSGLRFQAILSNEVRAFKALILVHKVLQDGPPVAIEEAQSQTGWLETCSRTIGHDGGKGYGPLIRTYVQYLLAKLRFHKRWPEVHGLFGYEEYVNLNGTANPNEGYETISGLMQLQDSIESFQKTVFSHLRASTNNECRISSLVRLAKESWGIYRFITGMLRAMYRTANNIEVLEPLRQRYHAQHYSLRKFYSECSNLKYLTGRVGVPELGPEPRDLFDDVGAPDLPARPITVAESLTPGSGAPMSFPATTSISAPAAAGPSSAPAAAPPPLSFPAPSQTQGAVTTNCARMERERWDRMDVLYQSIRSNARQFEYPAASVAALESVLVRMYSESPPSALHPQAHPTDGAPTVPLAEAAPQPPPPPQSPPPLLPPPEYTAICHEDQSNVLEVGPSRPWRTRAHDGTHTFTSASDIRSH